MIAKAQSPGPFATTQVPRSLRSLGMTASLPRSYVLLPLFLRLATLPSRRSTNLAVTVPSSSVGRAADC